MTYNLRKQYFKNLSLPLLPARGSRKPKIRKNTFYTKIKSCSESGRYPRVISDSERECQFYVIKMVFTMSDFFVKN